MALGAAGARGLAPHGQGAWGSGGVAPVPSSVKTLKTSSAKEPRNRPRAAGPALCHRSTPGGGTLPIQGSLSHAVDLPWLPTRGRAGLGAHGHRPPSPGEVKQELAQGHMEAGQRLRGQHPGLHVPSAGGGPWRGALTWALGLLIGVHDDWALVKEN